MIFKLCACAELSISVKFRAKSASMLKNYYLACIFFKSFYSLLLIATPRQSDCDHCAQNLGNDSCIQLGVTGMPAWPGSHRKYPIMSSTCGKRLVLESVLW